MTLAEVRRNEAVGQAATIPYSRCHSQARVVADPKKNHRHSQRSWHPPEGQRAAPIEYESYETSFVIRNYFDAVLIQPVCCTYRIPLPDKPSSTCEESRESSCSAHSCHASSSEFCHVSHPLRKGRWANSVFGKKKWDDNWPFPISHKNVAVSIQHRPLSHVARSCRTTRHSPFLAPAMLRLNPLIDHSRRAEPILNGLKYRTRAPTSFQHIVAPLIHAGAQRNLPVCGNARLQA